MGEEEEVKGRVEKFRKPTPLPKGKNYYFPSTERSRDIFHYQAAIIAATNHVGPA